MIFLLVAGIGFLLAGLVSIGFGVPVKEFSFGNTLILSGVAGGCTGAILLGLHVLVREIRAMGADPDEAAEQPSKARPVFPQVSPGDNASKDAVLFPGDHSESDQDEGVPDTPAAGPGAAPMPWQNEGAARDRLRSRGAEPAAHPAAASPAAEATAKRRNLLFSSSSRRERERAAGESGGPEGAPAATVPSRGFDDAWTGSEQLREDAGPRRARPPLDLGEAREPSPERPALLERSPPPRSEEMTEVTVLKSGVVDGMAYSLYSDGSIEAQMPEGMMRFASIDELREHLDQRS